MKGFVNLFYLMGQERIRRKGRAGFGQGGLDEELGYEGVGLAEID